MKWFTIQLVNPPKAIAAKFKLIPWGESTPKAPFKNLAGQFIAFDGPAKWRETMDAASKLSEEAGEVYVFEGKNLGLILAAFKGGKAECSYCGKYHL